MSTSDNTEGSINIEIGERNADSNDSEEKKGDNPKLRLASIKSLANFEDKPIRLGNCCAFRYKGVNPLIVIGPHWPLYLGTTIFITIVSLFIIFFVIAKVTFYGMMLGVIIFIFQALTYGLTATMNPGIPDRNLTKLRNTKEIIDKYPKIRYCKKCGLGIIDKTYTIHCDDCNICVKGKDSIILGYDHHCPWTGKCIGSGNIIWFNCFLGSTSVLIMYLIMGACFCA